MINRPLTAEERTTTQELLRIMAWPKQGGQAPQLQANALVQALNPFTAGGNAGDASINPSNGDSASQFHANVSENTSGGLVGNTEGGDEKKAEGDVSGTGFPLQGLGNLSNPSALGLNLNNLSNPNALNALGNLNVLNALNVMQNQGNKDSESGNAAGGEGTGFGGLPAGNVMTNKAVTSMILNLLQSATGANNNAAGYNLPAAFNAPNLPQAGAESEVKTDVAGAPPLTAKDIQLALSQAAGGGLLGNPLLNQQYSQLNVKRRKRRAKKPKLNNVGAAAPVGDWMAGLNPAGTSLTGTPAFNPTNSTSAAAIAAVAAAAAAAAAAQVRTC